MAQRIRAKRRESGAGAAIYDDSRETPLLTLPALSATVGTLRAREGGGGCLVQFFADRCEYVFPHPHAAGAVVEMVMMQQAAM